MTAAAGGLPSAAIAQAFHAACLAELTALKPGNVHVHAGGHHMEVAQFRAAAAAASKCIAEPSLSFGARVEAAVDASMAAAGCNTNLGIIQLSAPLAAAALLDAGGVSLRDRTRQVLAGLTASDARHVYSAIRRANPGGLGRSEEADVAAPPAIGLIDAMRIAAPRDRIAAAYANDFGDIFTDHLPLLQRLEAAAGAAPGASGDDVTATLYMSMLARFPDSHIRRKLGMETAAHVQTLACAARPLWHPRVDQTAYSGLLGLDALLKANGFNPGTTADFTVATLLASELDRRLGF
ncbi:MAG: triphosphoribosyl-dephospho-CoA synthase [Hyphomicrobiaceae bacterium]